MNSDDATGKAFIECARASLRESSATIKHCLLQLQESDVWWRPFEQANSIGNIVLHLCGNLGQWVVSGVGGAPDTRKRPEEFAAREQIPIAELLRRLSEVIASADAAMARLPTNQLLKTRHVQHWDITGLAAIFDSVSHFVGHTHQIVYVTRLRSGDRYQFRGLDAKSD
jgi:hypothetical protein